MPTLDLSNFNKVCVVGGGFIISFGLVSFLLKETLYLSESFVALFAGILFSKSLGLGLIDPFQYANGSLENLDAITKDFTRLVLGVQLMLTGIQLPKKYLFREWKSLAMLLGPVMILMWAISSLIIWLLVPHITLIGALAIAACITPTDPILANSIVKGKFAEKFIAPRLQNIIISESGANDGLGYPFLFIALYLNEYNNQPRKVLSLWCGDTLLYVIGASVVYGAVLGWLAMKALQWVGERGWIERESFLVSAIALALFIVGTCGLVGSDDVLACFIAGNIFTMDDWYRIETEGDSLQPIIDLLLNLSIFLYFGATAPWNSFRNSEYVSLFQLFCVSILILLLRRLPAILLTFKYTPAIQGWMQAVFAGYFGPIGVSAVFYLTVLIDYTHGLGGDDEFVIRLRETARLVVWFMMVSSVIVHGITVPMIMLVLNFKTRVSSGWIPFTGQSVCIEALGDIDPLPLFGSSLVESSILSPSKSPSYGSALSSGPRSC